MPQRLTKCRIKHLIIAIALCAVLFFIVQNSIGLLIVAFICGSIVGGFFIERRKMVGTGVLGGAIGGAAAFFVLAICMTLFDIFVFQHSPIIFLREEAVLRTGYMIVVGTFFGFGASVLLLGLAELTNYMREIRSKHNEGRQQTNCD